MRQLSWCSDNAACCTVSGSLWVLPSLLPNGYNGGMWPTTHRRLVARFDWTCNNVKSKQLSSFNRHNCDCWNKHHAMRKCVWGVEVQRQVFITLILDGHEWLISCRGQNPGIGDWVDPRTRSIHWTRYFSSAGYRILIHCQWVIK
jgi:hypothetical protein